MKRKVEVTNVRKDNLIVPDVEEIRLNRVSRFANYSEICAHSRTASSSRMCSQDKVEHCSRTRNEKVKNRDNSFLILRKNLNQKRFIISLTFIFLSIVSICSAQQQQQSDGGNIADERCFLQAGGSTASFFVKEDLAVGSLVGQLRIKGDVGDNINLTLTPSDGPLRIENQDLILTQQLDKEGIDGPSFLNVDVTCHRLATFDPGLTQLFYIIFTFSFSSFGR
jgi:hypothetical protein